VKRYRFKLWQNLIIVRAAIESEHRFRVAQLMVDTGSSKTVLPWEKLEDLGYDPAVTRERHQIFTVDSMIVVPQVRLQGLYCLGKMRENFPVLCHTFPFSPYAEGLLGMDFLRAFDISIHVRRGYIKVE
jgi:predicted aspartyl protease